MNNTNHSKDVFMKIYQELLTSSLTLIVVEVELIAWFYKRKIFRFLTRTRVLLLFGDFNVAFFLQGVAEENPSGHLYEGRRPVIWRSRSDHSKYPKTCKLFLLIYLNQETLAPSNSF